MLLNICVCSYRERCDPTVILEKMTGVTQESLEAYKNDHFPSFVYIGCVTLLYKT